MNKLYESTKQNGFDSKGTNWKELEKAEGYVTDQPLKAAIKF
jgi:hypothetical protein